VSRPGTPDRRGGSFAGTLLLGGASAVVAAVASNAVWAERAADTPGPAGSNQLTGSDLVPLVVPLALVTLACWGAVLVLRRRGRRVVAVIGAAAGLAAAAVVVGRVAGADDVTGAWPWVVAAAALVTALAFARAWVAAPAWPEMSGRYDRRDGREPAEDDAPGAQTATELWRALDEGRDPTA
jgi:hypothetical protein